MVVEYMVVLACKSLSLEYIFVDTIRNWCVVCCVSCVYAPLNENVSDKKGFPIYHAPTLLHSHIGIVHATIHNLMGQKRSKMLSCTIFLCVPKSQHANSGWLYGRSSIVERDKEIERKRAWERERQGEGKRDRNLIADRAYCLAK